MTVARTAFVMKNGNDGTGIVERFDKPFLTLQGATTALSAAFPVGGRTNSNRLLVVVYEGEYVGNLILEKFIDYDLGSATINGRIWDNRIDLGPTSPGQWTNKISGNARLINTSVSVLPGTILILKPNTKLLVQCDEIITSKFEAIAIENGIMKVTCNRIVTEDLVANFSPAIELLQGTADSDFTFSKLEIVGADITTRAGANSSTIQFNSGGASKNQVLSLINCRVSNPNNLAIPDSGRSAIAAGVVGSSDAKVLLYNTTLYSLNGNSIFVNGVNVMTISFYHSNMANKAIGGAGVVNTLIGALTINPAVEPGF
jgi:hypothetical protein